MEQMERTAASMEARLRRRAATEDLGSSNSRQINGYGVDFVDYLKIFYHQYWIFR